MQGQVQQFASAPQAVGSRSKYRDDDGKGNIMNDRRVVRGNTYASLVTPQQDMAELQKQREAQRRRLMRANQTKKRVGTPEPIPGRKHMDIQTDSYLEELTERTVEFEAETQTDFLLDRPPSPLFMPAKIGVDIDTQIEEGDLFDFDSEVEPVLEVLVGKTLEQSMMEVLEEEELESLRRHQEDFEKRRNAEMLEVQRMEAAEKRRSDEMERRMEQQVKKQKQDLSTMKKIVCRSIAVSHLSSLKDRAFASLNDAGVFADTVQGAVESSFVPQLLQNVSSGMQQSSQDLKMASLIMRSAVKDKLTTQSKALDKERKRLAAIDEAEKKVRIEAEQERLRKEGERQRIKAEKEAMIAWESWQPPPPPEVTVKGLTAEDPPKAQIVDKEGNEREVTFPQEKLQELKDLLEKVQADTTKRVVASELEDPAHDPTQEQGPPATYVDDFKEAEAIVDPETQLTNDPTLAADPPTNE
jgi:hypothetical protein